MTRGMLQYQFLHISFPLLWNALLPKRIYLCCAMCQISSQCWKKLYIQIEDELIGINHYLYTLYPLQWSDLQSLAISWAIGCMISTSWSEDRRQIHATVISLMRLGDRNTIYARTFMTHLHSNFKTSVRVCDAAAKENLSHLQVHFHYDIRFMISESGDPRSCACSLSSAWKLDKHN